MLLMGFYYQVKYSIASPKFMGSSITRLNSMYLQGKKIQNKQRNKNK